MVSYTRARGEALGVDVNIGTMQRPERLFYLGVVTVCAPVVEALFGHGPLPPFAAAVVALVMLGVTANVTAVRRIVYTLRCLERADRRRPSAARPRPGRRPRRRRPRASPICGAICGAICAAIRAAISAPRRAPRRCCPCAPRMRAGLIR